MIMKRGTGFVYLFRHFNLTPVRNLICTSALQLAPVLLYLPVYLYKLPFPFINMLHVKFGFVWPSGFREEDVWILRSYTCIQARDRGRQPLGDVFFFMNINRLSVCILTASFPHLISFSLFYPILIHWRPKLALP